MRRSASDIHTLAAAYALDALDGDDREAFAHHLRRCEACHQDVTEFGATAARLAAAVSQSPPPELRRRTLTAIAEVRQQPPRVAVPKRGSGSWRHALTPLALAASLVAAASFAGLAAWQYRTGEEHQRRISQSQQRLDDISAVLAAPDARTVRGEADNGARTALVVSRRAERAVFTAVDLPAPASGTTYQLWLDHRGTMHPAGFIRRDGTVLVEGDPSGATAVGLTLEPVGGSSSPTTPPLLLMPLTA
ncbi:anti-sigma factor [Streptomyces sp. JNUCC 64]